MSRDSPLACKDAIQPTDLINVPLICSRQAMKQTFSNNEFANWFGDDFDKLNVIATYNLAYNVAIMVTWKPALKQITALPANLIIIEDVFLFCLNK